jgi:Domain of unknown function (DUF6916)
VVIRNPSSISRRGFILLFSKNCFQDQFRSMKIHLYVFYNACRLRTRISAFILKPTTALQKENRQMAISRRKFVKAASLLTLSVSAPVKAAQALGWTNSRSGSESFSSATSTSFLDMQSFSRCLGTTFVLTDSTRKSTNFKLIEVHNYHSNVTLTAGRECFSLIFLAGDTVRLPQDTYTVDHTSLGKFQLFVVPIRGNTNGRYYEAVFNRLH